ncbi:copper resistance protein NlpE [Algoriphagus namhaensis]|uniref:Copper resistance protein NlpE n=1 Tax=Algoriphagus namhaensis TaxID=915353 RepID=A0ABV8APK5_9BACT
MNKFIPAYLILLLLGACESKISKEVSGEENIKEETVNIPLGDNSQVSLDWNGTYKGTIPCADCEGIETTLTLNTDLTYVLVTNYLGRNDALEERNSGSFTWGESGSKITLENTGSGPHQYKVGENRLWHLDMNGEVITGDLADHYILTKQ